nr:MAG TPA: hypothetical protein [Caudoviricetes sp.]
MANLSHIVSGKIKPMSCLVTICIFHVVEHRQLKENTGLRDNLLAIIGFNRCILRRKTIAIMISTHLKTNGMSTVYILKKTTVSPCLAIGTPYNSKVIPCILHCLPIDNTIVF